MLGKHKRHRKKLNGFVPLRMTSMMDILTVLLLFLLKSFVVEGEVISPVPGVDLPESSSAGKPKSSIVIAIFDNSVMMDGEVVANVSDALESGDLLIVELANRLDQARETILDIARERGSDEEFEGKVAIQGDKEIEFSILQRVMFTCSNSGFEDISLAVIGTS